MNTDKAGYELRDHTADIALFAWGDSLESLFCAAAAGLYATVGELTCHSETHNETLRFQAADVESLLHDFLAELHFRLETQDVCLADFSFTRLDDTILHATADVARIDRDASIFDHEIKAVTYHEVNIIRHDNRYEVTLILDI
ncbi:MAG: archease [Phycisphaerae bacterium]